jgi:PilZ domain
MPQNKSHYRTPAPARVDQRKDPRHIVLLRAAFIEGKSQSYEGNISEMSIYGCRLVTGAPFKTGDRVAISFDAAYTYTARIVWKEAEFLGCRFEDALAPQILREMTLGLSGL